MIYEEFAHNQRTRLPEANAADLHLWAAVFTTGLRDFAVDMLAVEQGKFPTEPSYWFWSPAETTGSFTWLCDLFKVDPQRARAETLAKWRDLLPNGGISPADTQHKNK